MPEHVHLCDRSAMDDASALIESFGGGAGDEAAARARRSRDLGNVIHYCRWRQIERIIALFTGHRAGATVH